MLTATLRTILDNLTDRFRRRNAQKRPPRQSGDALREWAVKSAEKAPTVTHIVCPLRNTDFVTENPLNSRPEYWATYGLFIARALQSLGIPLTAPAQPGENFVIEWYLDNGRCLRTGVSFSDFFWDFDSSEGVDGLFKERYHPGRISDVQPPPIPIAAAGFGLAVSGGYGDYEAFVANTLPLLRQIKDSDAQVPNMFHNSAHFRTIGVAGPYNYPNRERFRQALNIQPGGFEPAGSWLEKVARSAWVLNLCGSGNSIDRKVVELCAIGCAIISDRGLDDLELPNGGRFMHGENVWFVDDPEDLLEVPEVVVGDVWRRLVDGSRRLYDTSFQPDQVGRWFLQNVQTWSIR